MKLFGCIAVLSLLPALSAQAEVIDAEGDALAIYGAACEDIKAGEQNAATRIKATDKACFTAVSSLPEIINIKDSFDEHDFNVMIYNIVDEYIEDLTTKTTEQSSEKICIEVSGYITPENIGKAIDQTIQMPAAETETVTIAETPAEPAEEPVFADNGNELLSPASAVKEDSQHIVVLSSIFVRPTEFYNKTQSTSHSHILENILSQSENIRLADSEEEATFVITPKVLKAKIEPLNSETSRMQMVVALETFDRNKNSTTTEHQNKFVLFNNNDDEQSVAKDLLKQLFEQGSIPLITLAQKSSKKTYQQHFLPEILTAAPSKVPV